MTAWPFLAHALGKTEEMTGRLAQPGTVRVLCQGDETVRQNEGTDLGRRVWGRRVRFHCGSSCSAVPWPA